MVLIRPESDDKNAVMQWNDIVRKCLTTGTFSLAPNEKTEGTMFTHMDPTLVFIVSIATLLMKLEEIID
jgi:hypothetical protein